MAVGAQHSAASVSHWLPEAFATGRTDSGRVSSCDCLPGTPGGAGKGGCGCAAAGAASRAASSASSASPADC